MQRFFSFSRRYIPAIAITILSNILPIYLTVMPEKLWIMPEHQNQSIPIML